LRQPAPQRGDREAEHARDEDVFGAVDVAEPAAGDDQRRIGDQIDRDDRFDLRRARIQLDRNGRDGDVDDEGVDPEHELRGHHDRQHPQAARGVDGVFDDLVHDEPLRFFGPEFS
jgi:hypothetical protein